MDAATSGEVVSKGQFAECFARPVLQCISGGKIKPDALFGAGRNAKINVAVATRQLRDAHGVDQLTGDGVGTRLDLPLRVPLPAAPAREPAPAPSGDPLADAIKQQRLGQRANRREPGKRRRGRASTSTRPRPSGRWA